MWGIWCEDEQDWLRESPSRVDDGGKAILAFESEAAARRRAAKHYAFDTYTEAKEAGFCEVRRLMR